MKRKVAKFLENLGLILVIASILEALGLITPKLGATVRLIGFTLLFIGKCLH